MVVLRGISPNTDEYFVMKKNVTVTCNFDSMIKRKNYKTVLLYFKTFTQQNKRCDWLILGHVPPIEFKCIPTVIQLRSCCPRAEYNSTFFLFLP